MKTTANNERMSLSICCYGGEYCKDVLLCLANYSQRLLASLQLDFDIIYSTKDMSIKSKKNKFSIRKLEDICNDEGYFTSRACIGMKKDAGTGWESDYSIYLAASKNHTIISFAEDGLELGKDVIKDIICKYSFILNSPYCIGYFMPYSKGPYFYSCAIQYNNSNHTVPRALQRKDVTAQDRFSRWGGVGLPHKVYLRGVVRDIYPYNLLNPAQVNFSFDGKTLLEQVCSKNIPGVIEEISPKRFLWTIKDEEDILQVTQVCENAGFIFDNINNLL